jgi:hypothetical protein
MAKTVYHRNGRNRVVNTWTDSRGVRHVSQHNGDYEALGKFLLVILLLGVIVAAAALWVVVLLVLLLAAGLCAAVDGIVNLASLRKREPKSHVYVMGLAKRWVNLTSRNKSNNKQVTQQQEIVRDRPGPRDPWLNEIAVELADLDFTEYARNTATQMAGVPIEGNIRLDADRFSVTITLLATAELARQAEVGLRAKPEVRAAIIDGKTIVSAVDVVLYVANGRGGVVDELTLNDVKEVVGDISIGPRRTPVVTTGPPATPAPTPKSTPHPPPLKGDVLDQLERLAALRDEGILSDQEFEAKKPELLRRMPQSRDDVLEQIKRLAGLRADGVVSDEEFETTKADLLRHM